MLNTDQESISKILLHLQSTHNLNLTLVELYSMRFLLYVGLCLSLRQYKLDCGPTWGSIAPLQGDMDDQEKTMEKI